ncbi:Dehydrogenase/reductase SDR family member 7B [Mycena sanguinolenta]|uniref:Dehydrogenase/reductase SDR family member 7B n=1 Tax=Mycena sanguinolenta TaxID=230812 RepID=A0A8H7DCH8_9AGAR|nr:Dehydrogenase/reductase SDR family member 7B [Mycena sanguinolenta]
MASPLRTYFLAALALAPIFAYLRKQPKRSSTLPHKNERVLIIGASSGIGRTLAHEYAKLGAKGVCVIGRRADKIAEVVAECNAYKGPHTEVIGITGDFAEVEDMVRAREQLESRWGGIDTMIVAAGVSALLPLMEITGVKSGNADKEGIQRVVDVVGRASRGNYVGPLVAAVTFVPLLESSSPCPSILLVNSLASVLPAPTRSVYASSKAASLLLYQALSIEHPRIAFSHVLPATIEGDFRASAVDGGTVREADPNKSGLKREAVARRCIAALEYREKNVYMPGLMGVAHVIYLVWPSFIERYARAKYNFTPAVM